MKSHNKHPVKISSDGLFGRSHIPSISSSYYPTVHGNFDISLNATKKLYPSCIETPFNFSSTMISTSNSVVELLHNDQLVFTGSPQEFIHLVHEKPEHVIAVLTETIISLRRTLRYNGVYTAYLLGQLGDDEFSKEAEKFSFEPDECYSDELQTKTKILMRAINESVSASEISDIFKVDIGVAEQILKAISENLEFKCVEQHDY